MGALVDLGENVHFTEAWKLPRSKSDASRKWVEVYKP